MAGLQDSRGQNYVESCKKSSAKAGKWMLRVKVFTWVKDFGERRLLLAEGNVAAQHRECLRRDVQKRGDGIKRQLVHDSWAAPHQQVVTFTGSGTVKVDVTFMKLAEDVLANEGTHSHRFLTLVKELLQLLAAEP